MEEKVAVKGSRAGDDDNIVYRDISFNTCPKYQKHELTADQIDEIAEKAAIKAISKAVMQTKEELKNEIIMDIGLTGLNAIKYILGIGLLGLFYWLVKHDIIKP